MMVVVVVDANDDVSPAVATACLRACACMYACMWVFVHACMWVHVWVHVTCCMLHGTCVGTMCAGDGGGHACLGTCLCAGDGDGTLDGSVDSCDTACSHMQNSSACILLVCV